VEGRDITASDCRCPSRQVRFSTPSVPGQCRLTGRRPAATLLHVRPISEQAPRRRDRSHLRHAQPAPELSGALQHRADRPGAHRALQPGDQGALAGRAALGLAPALGQGSEDRREDDQRPGRGGGDPPSIRDAFKSRRCIIPASGFYEWVQTGATKQPYAIVPEGDPLFAFDGLWESWRDRSAGEGAEWIRTCTIITGEPNELVALIHNRMPVMLPREAWSAWLGEEPADKDALLSLLKPCPAERMRAYAVSARVNSVKNDEPALLDDVAAA
jgi:hypothetical protein